MPEQWKKVEILILRFNEVCCLVSYVKIFWYYKLFFAVSLIILYLDTRF